MPLATLTHDGDNLQLESSEQHRGKWLLLQIFAYGVLQDYKGKAQYKT